MKYVTYYRVSTKKQGIQGLGMEAQKTAVNQYLANRTHEIVGEYKEALSGRKDNRPELHKALRQCRLTGATLLVAKLDRLSRSRRFLNELMESSVEFVCADMPEANTLTISLLAALAEYEATLISERTKAALKEAKKRGTKLGNPKLHLVRNNDTKAATIKRSESAQKHKQDVKEIIHEIIDDAGESLSYRVIATKLNDAGYKTARGSEFTAVQVMRALAA